MLLGLDFDNTIANYNASFIELAVKNNLINNDWNGDKKSLRDFIRTLPNGEYSWQMLQGQIYGKWMHKAIMFDGVKEFLLKCKEKSIHVVIISHKTKYGNHDKEKFFLRAEAMKWMQKNGLFNDFDISKNDVYFESTKENKIRRIESIGCTHYIDDLVEILTDEFFPIHTKKILFSDSKNRHHFNDIHYFSDWEKLEVSSII
jgi:hypothetical protein